jgi:hypothetical protein
MKKLFLPLVTVMFLSFTSCDDVKSLADIPINDLEVSTELMISPILAKNEITVTFDASEDLNPKDNADVKEHFSKIKKWTNKEVKVTVVSVNYEGKGTPKLLKGATVNIGSAKYTLEKDFSIKRNESFILDDNEFLKASASELSKGKTIKVSANGKLSDYVTFTLKVSVKFDIVANPL